MPTVNWIRLGSGGYYEKSINDGGSFSQLSLASVKTDTESWVGPSNTLGLYFKSSKVGLGTVTPGEFLHLKDGANDLFFKVEQSTAAKVVGIKISNSGTGTSADWIIQINASGTNLRFINNGTTRFAINSGGGVVVNAAYTLPSVDGTNDQVLTTNGSGAVTWTGKAGGGGSGLTNLNGQAGATQAFANDTNVTIVSATNTHTLTWAGLLGLARGGVNADLSATGGAKQVLKQATAGAAITVGTISSVDLSDYDTLGPFINVAVPRASIGDGTGVVPGNTSANNTTNLNALLASATYCPVAGAVLYFPPGAYSFNNNITVTNQNVWFMGGGQQGTVFSFTAGGIVCSFNNTLTQRFQITDITLVSFALGTETAISIAYSSSVESGSNQGMIRDVTIRAGGTNQFQSSWWAKGIALSNVQDVYIQRCNISGSSGNPTTGSITIGTSSLVVASSTGYKAGQTITVVNDDATVSTYTISSVVGTTVTISGVASKTATAKAVNQVAPYAGTYGITATNRAVGIFVFECDFRWLEYAFKGDKATESVWMKFGAVGACDYGFYVDGSTLVDLTTPAQSDGFQVIGNDMACRKRGIYMDNTAQGIFSQNVFYNYPGNFPFIAIQLTGGSFFNRVCENMFVKAYASTNNYYGAYINGTVNNISNNLGQGISGDSNPFQASIFLDTGNDYNILVGNNYFAVAANIVTTIGSGAHNIASANQP